MCHCAQVAAQLCATVCFTVRRSCGTNQFPIKQWFLSAYTSIIGFLRYATWIPFPSTLYLCLFEYPLVHDFSWVIRGSAVFQLLRRNCDRMRLLRRNYAEMCHCAQIAAQLCATVCFTVRRSCDTNQFLNKKEFLSVYASITGFLRYATWIPFPSTLYLCLFEYPLVHDFSWIIRGSAVFQLLRRNCDKMRLLRRNYAEMRHCAQIRRNPMPKKSQHFRRLIAKKS